MKYYAIADLHGRFDLLEAARQKIKEHTVDLTQDDYKVIFLGDYIDIDSSAGAAHPIWIDTRNHKADAYTATIERPSANAAA